MDTTYFGDSLDDCEKLWNQNPCPLCNTAFNSESDVKQHVRKNHFEKAIFHFYMGRKGSLISSKYDSSCKFDVVMGMQAV